MPRYLTIFKNEDRMLKMKKRTFTGLPHKHDVSVDGRYDYLFIYGSMFSR